MKLDKKFYKPGVSLTIMIVLFLTRWLPHNGSFFKVTDYVIFFGIIVGLYFFERLFTYIALMFLALISSASLMIVLGAAIYIESYQLFLCQAILFFSLAGGSMILFKKQVFTA